MSAGLKFPAGLESALFLMVTSCPESYEARLVSSAQVLSTWGEWMYGSLADANENDVVGFSETVADPDCWYANAGKSRQLDWEFGEGGGISLSEVTDIGGVELIALERARQLTVKGWSAEHDDAEHETGDLAKAAASYLATVSDPDTYAAERGRLPSTDGDWPFDRRWWKPSHDPVRNLVKAGALIAAEIDRLNRARVKQGGAK